MLKEDIDLLRSGIIDKKRYQLLSQLNIRTINDLLSYYPRKYLDRKTIISIKDLHKFVDDRGNSIKEVNLIVRVTHKNLVDVRKKKILNVTFSDGTGFINSVWFVYAHFFNKSLLKGNEYLISGRVSYKGRWEIAHPEFELIDKESFEGEILPVYPLKNEIRLKGVNSKYLREVVKSVYEKYSDKIIDIIPKEIVEKNSYISLRKAIYSIHFPENVRSKNLAINRLKFNELFYLQSVMISQKLKYKRIKSDFQISDSGRFLDQFYRSLPFDLTLDQKNTIRDIYKDFKSGTPMNRLVQGDVGSGKTMVALATILIMVGNGYQCAIMAPTEILAEQHYINFKNYCKDFDVNISLITGKMRKKLKDEVITNIASGITDIAIGTHALFQKDIQFSQLGYVVIDEQHRFGVTQRGDLITKSSSLPHILVMTATPIPRTITLSLYGDLEISSIKTMPLGRKPVKTAIRGNNSLEKIYSFIGKEIDEGKKAYIVFPLVEKSERSDMNAAVDQYMILKTTVFSKYKVGLLHGKMKSFEKEEIMEGFKGDDYDILISTTVIEVGVDIKTASVILIMHSERFGLAQLHQLRGRVGRSDIQSYCILHFSDKISEDSLERLKIMENTNDGFELSEKDFELRGPGEFFGEKQSGITDLKLVSLIYDRSLIFSTRRIVEKFLEKDPDLSNSKELKNYLNKNYSQKIDILKF
ncbi:MAG: ATP-dependent DNA helicase RecG [Candidatus Cloacimonadota bacterium]|nr:MAG: ATP-dependent DNA helicase RecG [Candidatus Cloacimonadota bacterium]PIE78590.1 MAG: ATP-dependent DNA helicase RecG [Candidatus Delongbacteria bacterium]